MGLDEPYNNNGVGLTFIRGRNSRQHGSGRVIAGSSEVIRRYRPRECAVWAGALQHAAQHRLDELRELQIPVPVAPATAGAGSWSGLGALRLPSQV